MTRVGALRAWWVRLIHGNDLAVLDEFEDFDDLLFVDRIDDFVEWADVTLLKETSEADIILFDKPLNESEWLELAPFELDELDEFIKVNDLAVLDEFKDFDYLLFVDTLDDFVEWADVTLFEETSEADIILFDK